MEFKFNVNEVLKSPIVEINHTLIPPGFNGDRRALWDSVSKISEIVNAMGDSSAVAQGLNKPITTSDRLRNSDQTIYLLVDKNAKNGKGVVTGMLKTGKKSLYIFDREGEHYKVSPPCILDFYVHESRQRTGLGKQLFEHMLQKEQVDPVKLAIDRPSEKLLSFLGKHYSLNNALRQMNNYVVFDGFFPESMNTHQIEETNTSESPCKTKPSANGLQNFPSPYGRYGAPRPTCSMGQIIHNQTSVQSNEPSGDNIGVNQTSLANDTSQIATTQQQNYRSESQPNICPSYTNAVYNQQQLTNNNQLEQNVMQQGLNSNSNIMQQYSTQLPQQSHNLSQRVQFNEQTQNYSQLPSQPITEMQQHEAYSNIQIPPQPNVHSQDQSQTNNAYQYYTNAQNQPVSNVQNQPIANVQSQPISNVQNLPISNVQYQPVSNVQTQPYTNVQTQPYTNVQSQPYTNVQSQPYTNVQSQPCTNVQSQPYINSLNQLDRSVPSQPYTNIIGQSHTNIQNQPSSSIQNQFYADAQSQHNIIAQGQTFLNSNNQNYTNAPSQSYTNIQSQSHANSYNQPYIQNQPLVNQQNQLYQDSRETRQHLNAELTPQDQTDKLHSRKLEIQVNTPKYRQRQNNGLSPLRNPSSDVVPNEFYDRGYPDLYRDKVLRTEKHVEPAVIQQPQIKSQYVPTKQQIQPQYVPSQQQQPAVLQYTSSQQQIQLQHPTSQLISQQSQPYHSQTENISSEIQHTQQPLISHNVSPPNQIINAGHRVVPPQFIDQQQSVPQLRINEQQNIASTPQIVSWKENVQPNTSICNVRNAQYIQPPNSEQPLCNHQITNIMPTQHTPQQFQNYDSTNQTLKSDVKQTYNTISNSQNVRQSYNASGDMIETQKPIQNYVTPTNTDELLPSSARLRTPRSRVHTPRCGLTQQELMPPTLNQDQSGQIMSPHSVQPQSQHMSGPQIASQ